MGTRPAPRPGAGKLWGGRFAGGPSPELEALTRSTHFDWRLASYDLAGSRAHARVLHACRSARPTTSCDGLLAGLDELDRRVAAGELRAAGRRRGRPRRPRGRAGRAGRRRAGRQAARRAQPQRPDRHAVQGLPARPRAGRSPAQVLDLADALADQAEQHLGAIMPGRTHLQHAQPVLLSHHLMAHAWPLVRDVARLRDWDARVAADSPYGSGCAGRVQPRTRPRGGRPRPRLHRLAPPTRSTARRRATSSPSSRSSPR